VRLSAPDKRALDEMLIRWSLTDLIAERESPEKKINGSLC